MAKLVEILARELKEWPEGARILVQDGDLEAKFGDSACLGSSRVVWERLGAHSSIYLSKLAEDWDDTQVTRAQWEDERARIAANQQATQEAREIAKTGTMTNEEKELAVIACGKRSAEDQALWDRVAKDLYCQWVSIASSKESWRIDAEYACNAADAFMAERAKRMEG